MKCSKSVVVVWWCCTNSSSHTEILLEVFYFCFCIFNRKCIQSLYQRSNRSGTSIINMHNNSFRLNAIVCWNVLLYWCWVRSFVCHTQHNMSLKKYWTVHTHTQNKRKRKKKIFECNHKMETLTMPMTTANWLNCFHN